MTDDLHKKSRLLSSSSREHCSFVLFFFKREIGTDSIWSFAACGQRVSGTFRKKSHRSRLSARSALLSRRPAPPENRVFYLTPESVKLE